MFNLMSLKALGAVAALVTASWVGAASASTVTTYCPEGGTSSDSVRNFSVTIDDANGAADCLLTGTGNTDTPANKAAIDLANGAGSLLDKSDDPGADLITGVELITDPLGGTSGVWEIIVPDGYILTDVSIAFKSGQGGGDPDWALFSLPDDILSGTWAIDNPLCSSGCSGYQSLSHGSLYGVLVPAPVPLPAAGLLLLGGLGALGLAKRRRKAA